MTTNCYQNTVFAILELYIHSRFNRRFAHIMLTAAPMSKPRLVQDWSSDVAGAVLGVVYIVA